MYCSFSEVPMNNAEYCQRSVDRNLAAGPPPEV
jgi:hypothetical protein